jgi:hypothetical protein
LVQIRGDYETLLVDDCLNKALATIVCSSSYEPNRLSMPT